MKYPEKICQSMYFPYIKLLYFSVKVYFTIVISRSFFFFPEFIEFAFQVMSVRLSFLSGGCYLEKSFLRV